MLSSQLTFSTHPGHAIDAHASACLPAVPSLVGHSDAIAQLRRQIVQYASACYPVLITGESGSGKEVVANALHAHSARSAQPYLAVNCAAIAPSLVEATLFGHAKAAFTGATVARAGYFGEVDDGTLFLDEIGEIPLDVQAKLLRVLENGTYQRVGETTTQVSRGRIIAATNRDLKREAREGRYRIDLYHRLSVFTVSVPPLRRLGDDRRLLLEHFVEAQCATTGSPPFRLSADAMAMWMTYPFPGNVRELRNIVIRLTANYSGQEVSTQALLAELDEHVVDMEGSASDSALAIESAKQRLLNSRNFDLDALLMDCERNYVAAALALTNGNLSRAARVLGVARTTLYSRMQQYPVKLQTKGE